MSKTLIFGICFGLLFSSCAVSRKPEPATPLLEGKNFDYYFRQGAISLTAGDYNQAIEHFSKALSLDPNSARAFNLRGIAYFRQKNYRKAEDQFKQALALNPSYAEACTNLGSVYFATHQFEKARGMFERALALSPDSIAAHTSYGTLLLLLGEIEAGIRHLARGVELDPTYLDTHEAVLVDVPIAEASTAEIHFAYAKIYAEKGDIEKTLEYLTKAQQAGFHDWLRIEKEKEFEAVRQDPRIRAFLR
ncbi:MAG: tetratricopeptide repeat protein [Candidatus Aminicenantales bacterium]